MYAEITDTELNNDSPNPWEQDSIEVFMSETVHRDAEYRVGDGQYRVNQSSFFCLAARFDLDPNLTDRNIFLNLFVNIFTLSSNSNASTGNKSQLTVSSPGMLEMYKF